MMHRAGEAQYTSATGYEAVARTFLSASMVMLCVLPPEGQSEADFSAAQPTALPDALDIREVHLGLLKWKLAPAAMLKDPLRTMCMRDAFSGDADFSGIADAVWVCAPCRAELGAGSAAVNASRGVRCVFRLMWTAKPPACGHAQADVAASLSGGNS